MTKFFLDKNVYRLIKNVTIPADGGTTQIDHVIISCFGVEWLKVISSGKCRIN